MKMENEEERAIGRKWVAEGEELWVGLGLVK